MALRRKALPAVLVSLFLVAVLLSPLPLWAAEEGDGPRWGLIARYGYYGVPDWILDLLFEEHPSVDGTMAGVELRYYGDGGPRGVFSVGLALDAGSTEGSGIWQEEKESELVYGGGEVDLKAASVTLYWDLFPSSAVHPYVGLGLGAAMAKGTYQEGIDTITVEEIIPAVVLPVGILLNLGDHFGVSLEGRIIDGISYGGTVQVRF